jgi:hypothetical protein
MYGAQVEPGKFTLPGDTETMESVIGTPWVMVILAYILTTSALFVNKPCTSLFWGIWMELNIPSEITVPAEIFCPAVIIPTYCTCGVVWVEAAGVGEAVGRRQR